MTSLSRALVVIVAVVSAPLLNATPAQAQNFAIAGQVGTTGLGAGVVFGVAPKINVRAMYGVVPGDPSVTVEAVDFGLDLPSFLLTTVDLIRDRSTIASSEPSHWRASSRTWESGSATPSGEGSA